MSNKFSNAFGNVIRFFTTTGRFILSALLSVVPMMILEDHYRWPFIAILAIYFICSLLLKFFGIRIPFVFVCADDIIEIVLLIWSLAIVISHGTYSVNPILYWIIFVIGAIKCIFMLIMGAITVINQPRG